MNYLQPPYPLGGYTTYPIDQTAGYPAPVAQHAFDPSVDPYVLPYQQDGMTGYYVIPGRIEDYDEYIENLSRPRLTKEQVGTLEAQFQAQPKPNSHTKRQLALQTNLTLPRVAVWFFVNILREKEKGTRGTDTVIYRIGFKTAARKPSSKKGRRSSRKNRPVRMGNNRLVTARMQATSTIRSTRMDRNRRRPETVRHRLLPPKNSPRHVMKILRRKLFPTISPERRLPPAKECPLRRSGVAFSANPSR